MSATFHECLQNRRQHNIPYFSIEFIANSINGLNACGLWLLFNPPCTLKCHINDVSHLICSIQVSCRRVRNFSWSLRAASRVASHLLRLVTWRMNRFAHQLHCPLCGHDCDWCWWAFAHCHHPHPSCQRLWKNANYAFCAVWVKKTVFDGIWIISIWRPLITYTNYLHISHNANDAAVDGIDDDDETKGDSAEFAAFCVGACVRRHTPYAYHVVGKHTLFFCTSSHRRAKKWIRVNCVANAPRLAKRMFKWIFTFLVCRSFCRCVASHHLCMRAK